MLQVIDISKQQAVCQLKHIGIDVHSLQFLGAGDFTRAWLVNKEWVARFARHAEAEAALRREAELLPEIARHLTFHIPAPVFHQAASSGNLGFVTYPIVAGEELTRKNFLALNRALRTQCCEYAAQFLLQLHRVSLPGTLLVQLPVFNPEEQYTALFDKAKQLLLPSLKPDLALFIEGLFENYFANHIHLPAQPVLLHGDFGPPHILCHSGQPFQITGVIDFGDMQIGPPAWDLVYLFEDLGMEFMQLFLPCFCKDQQEALILAMYAYYQFDAVAWVIREIASNSPQRKIKAIAHLNRLCRSAQKQAWRKLL